MGVVDIRRSGVGYDGSLATVCFVSCPRVLPVLTGNEDMPKLTRNRMANETETHLSSMTAVWLLPIVSCIVAASSGGVVAGILPNEQYALWTVITSYVLWGMGIPLAMMVMVIYLMRLTLHKLPPKAVIVSVFLPLGPLGQGGYG